MVGVTLFLAALVCELLESIDTNAAIMIPIKTTIVKMNFIGESEVGDNWISFSSLILGL